MVLLTLSSAVFAQGERVDGTFLLRSCGSNVRLQDGDKNVDYQLAAYCSGAVHGVADVLDAFDLVSLPDGSSVGQLTRVVEKYLREHPEKLADRDTNLIAYALKEAFPAKKK